MQKARGISFNGWVEQTEIANKTLNLSGNGLIAVNVSSNPQINRFTSIFEGFALAVVRNINNTPLTLEHNSLLTLNEGTNKILQKDEAMLFVQIDANAWMQIS